MNYHERKQARTEYYFKHIHGKKMVKCHACNGSGWYDNLDIRGNSIECGGCYGRGKVIEVNLNEKTRRKR